MREIDVGLSSLHGLRNLTAFFITLGPEPWTFSRAFSPDPFKASSRERSSESSLRLAVYAFNHHAAQPGTAGRIVKETAGRTIAPIRHPTLSLDLACVNPLSPWEIVDVTLFAGRRKTYRIQSGSPARRQLPARNSLSLRAPNHPRAAKVPVARRGVPGYVEHRSTSPTKIPPWKPNERHIAIDISVALGCAVSSAGARCVDRSKEIIGSSSLA